MSGRPTLSSAAELGPFPPDLELGSSPLSAEFLEEVEEQADLPPESPWGEIQEMDPQAHPV